MTRRRAAFALAAIMAFAAEGVPGADGAGRVLTVASKKFTESVILGEIATQLARDAGASAIHRRELGGTRVLWNALVDGEIDVYPEYTGTLMREILAGRGIRSEVRLRRALAGYGVRMTHALGFNNTYVLGVKRGTAERLGLRTISDIKRYPELALGFSNEFMDRSDGWPGLRERYGLSQTNVRGLDHDLAYRGLESGNLDVIDLYATDAEIAYYDLRTLKDDLHYFPEYNAVILYRAELEVRYPAAVDAFEQLAGQIAAPAMVGMNARAKVERVPESEVAAGFLRDRFGIDTTVGQVSTLQRLWRHTKAHLALVAVSLTAAILVSIPLGIAAVRMPRMGQVILGATGIIQTIPSLALLVFMIPLLGIGGPPAVAALFLYSLLPIVRNTYAGLHDIPLSIRESAEALGLPPRARLRLVELPMASRAILAGIKTSAVINVGTATLGALIGAGGYGQPILTGIRLDDIGLILEGAVPAAILALLVQGAFEIAERALVPKGLRRRPET